MQGAEQKRFKYHLHDQERRLSHTLILRFEQITALYDRVELSD